MKKNKNIGCIGWILILLLLPLALIFGIIYGMIHLYKNGKFDNITSKLNELIAKLYYKMFKKILTKKVLTPKSFTIILTILIFLFISMFASDEETNSNDYVNTNQVVSNQNTLNNIDNNKIENNQEIVENENIIETTEAEIHFINTGNSDAILIKQGNKSALIDGGENDDEDSLVSYLKTQGITELEYIFATHPDADHIGGLDAVINSIPVKNVIVGNGDADSKTYSDFINAMASKNLNPSVPLLNSEFSLGSSTFKVLSVANTNDRNDNSLVLLYTNGNDKILFTGDISKEIENKLNVGDIDLLKVGHHGSKTSTSSEFIEKIKPEYAVILVGKNNKYNHPNSEVMNILENNNIKVHRTDECGDIIFKSSGNGLTVDCIDGSYDSGDTSSSSNTSSDYSSNYDISNIEIQEDSQTSSYSDNYESSDVEIKEETSNSEDTVYWTPNGKSYHSTKDCPTLSRSKTILSGTQSESNKSDACDKCH